MRVKLNRKIIGLVAEVRMPCGCDAIVAQGKALTESGVKHSAAHRCLNWKRHKYELADAERDLAKRLKTYRKYAVMCAGDMKPLTQEEAKRLMGQFHRNFPSLQKWAEEIRRKANDKAHSLPVPARLER
jgi:hypothetical protein